MAPKHVLLAFAIAIVLLPSTALVAANEAPEQDARWKEEARQLDFELLPDGFRADSTRTSELGNDELRAQYFLDEGRLRLRYVSDEPGNETVMTMDLGFLSLVEFRDSNGDGRYGFTDDLVQRIRVQDMEGASVASEPFLSGGRVASASYSFPNRSTEGNDSVLPVGNESTSLLPGSFDLRFYMVPSTVTFEGSKVTPLDIKFAIEVNRFPYKEAGTRMALETRFASNNAIQEAEWTERLLESRDGFFRGFFAWERVAEVDGTPRPVGVTSLSYGNSPTADDDTGVSSIAMAFAYPRGEQVVHDPTLGVMRTQGVVEDLVERLVEGDWLLYSLGLGVTLVAVGVPAGLRLRER